MNTREHYELFRYLMEKLCLFPEDILFVENVAEWCEDHGLLETDIERPMRLISKEDSGCLMLVKEYLSEEIMEERVNAMRIRSQLKDVASDRAERLNSDKKKLAYLFLSEYATSLPEVVDDFLADNWAFEEMERSGFFKDREKGG